MARIDIDEQIVKELFLNDKTLVQIAKEINVGRSTIQRKIKEFDWYYNRRVLDILNEAELKNMYFAKAERGEMAAAFNTTKDKIERNLNLYDWFHDLNNGIHAFPGMLCGKRFGKLVAKTCDRVVNKRGGVTYYICDCDCDGENSKNIRVSHSHLQSGHTTSCGCKKITGNKFITGAWWCGIVKSSEERGYDINITLEYITELLIIQDFKCALSGIDLAIPKYGIEHKDVTASLDRIDSRKGYLIGNVQWVFRKINYLKSHTPNEEFINYCYKIADWNRKK